MLKGLGGMVKRNKIKEVVRHHHVDFMAIQETKIESMSNSLCCSLFASDNCDWIFLPSAGSGGGILSLWKKSNSTFNFSFSE